MVAASGTVLGVVGARALFFLALPCSLVLSFRSFQQGERDAVKCWLRKMFMVMRWSVYLRWRCWVFELQGRRLWVIVKVTVVRSWETDMVMVKDDGYREGSMEATVAAELSPSLLLSSPPPSSHATAGNPTSLPCPALDGVPFPLPRHHKAASHLARAQLARSSSHVASSLSSPDHDAAAVCNPEPSSAPASLAAPSPQTPSPLLTNSPTATPRWTSSFEHHTKPSAMPLSHQPPFSRARAGLSRKKEENS
ncbi:hypothetical protein M0R45_015983 [Rubus argutus]|uniref:Uncharacterized protein n=1 Tax=Rubus argutus TaxID=59490 RepID=A0AAW1XTT2_RUBAR